MYKALLTLCVFYCFSSTASEIALTFDDCPTKDSPYFSGEERTAKLLDALEKANVHGAAFFCNSDKIKSDVERMRLKSYTSRGHVIGNHTHTHRGLKRLDAGQFIADIINADKALARFKGYKKWFRYPHLGRGKSEQIRDKVYRFLNEENYLDAYVTVDNFDFYMDHLFIKAVEGGKQINLENLKDAYIFALWDSIKFYDNLAKKVIKRSPKHVLLLHENDLAAMFVGDLVQFLQNKGWKIISAEDAYKDPISSIVPQTLRNGDGRIAAIASEKGYPNYETRDKYQSTKEIEKLFTRRKIFSN